MFNNLNASPPSTLGHYWIDCDLTESELEQTEPELWEYLQTGRSTVGQGYVCRSRKLWYRQEVRDSAPLLFSYAGRTQTRNTPFRFFLNHSRAVASNNLYTLIPKPLLASRSLDSAEALRPIWQLLNALPLASLLAEGRSYAGGFHKLQPRELANLPANELARLIGLSKEGESEAKPKRRRVGRKSRLGARS